MYYFFVDNNNAVGKGQCKCSSFINVEVEKSLYDSFERDKYIYINGNIELNPQYEDILKEKEQERLAMLNMTGADVERAIYKVKGIDFDDILAMVKDNPAIDEKALKIEFKANDFYRGNPYIEQVGNLLGFTTEMLDRFFDNKDYRYLTICKLTIKATPAEAIVTGAGSYPYGTTAHYKVECDGYVTVEGDIEMVKDEVLEVELIKDPNYVEPTEPSTEEPTKEEITDKE